MPAPRPHTRQVARLPTGRFLGRGRRPAVASPEPNTLAACRCSGTPCGCGRPDVLAGASPGVQRSLPGGQPTRHLLRRRPGEALVFAIVVLPSRSANLAEVTLRSRTGSVQSSSVHVGFITRVSLGSSSDGYGQGERGKGEPTEGVAG